MLDNTRKWTHQSWIQHYWSLSVSSLSKVKHWVVEFKRGCTGINDEPCSGYYWKKVCIVFDDRREKVLEITVIVGFTDDSEHRILSWELEIKNYSARWVALNCFSHIGTFLLLYEVLFAPFHNRRGNLCLPFQFRNRRKVSTLYTRRFSPTKESKNGCISSKGYGICILGFSCYYLGRLLREGQTINGEYYSNLL